ncbi:MAG: lantibiotic dehydratase [Kofleriaceae bacterium]
MMTPYRMAPIFGVRPTGVAFEVLDRLGTPAITEAARRLVQLDAFATAATAEALVRTASELADHRTLRSRLEGKLKRRATLTADRLVAHPWLVPHEAAVGALRAAEAALEQLIEREYGRIHEELKRSALQELPDFLVIESEDFASELDRLAHEPPGDHTRKDRQRDRTLALYLQRVCAKNDTISRFGPAAWGTIGPGDGLVLRPGEITDRRVELERWAVFALLALANGEPDVRPEAAPRLHPLGRFEGATFHRLDDERAIALTADERALVDRCDGTAPAHQLGSLELLASLAERGVLRWELEPMAVDASPLTSLVEDVARWREGTARDRWQPRLAALVDLVARFGADTSAPGRHQLLRELRGLLARIGITP